MRVGLFGGSFNPVHNGQIKVANNILEKGIVDEVWFIPCKKHSFDKSLANEKDRLAMLKIATNGLRQIKVSYIEMKSQGKNYSIDTLRKLKSMYPDKEFFNIIGSDILHEITKWHEFKQLLKETSFIVFERKGYDVVKIPGMKLEYVIECNEDNLSSTEIRERIDDSSYLKNVLSSEVIKYIRENKLYLK